MADDDAKPAKGSFLGIDPDKLPPAPLPRADEEPIGDEAADPDRGEKPSGRRRPSINRVADEIINSRRLLTDATNTVYSWDGAFWSPLAEPALMQLALEAAGSNSSARHRNEIVAYIRAKTFKPDLKWGRVADHEIALANGVVDALSGALRPHRFEDYLEKVAPVPLRVGGTATAWLAALETWFDRADAPRAQAIQEFFGYVLLSHARFKRALLIEGPQDCGKSVIIWVAQQLVGEANCCQLSVEHMDDPTRRAVIKGKALNVMTELSSEAMIADGGFKTLISTEEPILIDQKYKVAEMYVPTAKHVIATNHLPRMTERSEEVISRLLIVPMRRSIPREAQDRDLRAKLSAELPAIAEWAIAGAKRLIARKGQFVDPPEGHQVLAELRSDAQPFRAFLLERAERDPGAAVPLSHLAAAFNRWNGGGTKATARSVGKASRQAFNEDAVATIWKGDRNIKCLIGWRLVSSGEEKEMDVSYDPATQRFEAVEAAASPPAADPKAAF